MFLKQPKSHIILALDTPNRAKSLEIMEQCHDVVDGVKFNYPLLLTEGLSLLTEIKKTYGLPIIADLKVADVPVTNNRLAKLVKEAGADAIMVHGFIGSDAILEIKEIAGEDMGVIVVTELTHPGGLEFTRQHAEDFARLAVFLECCGIQAPGTRPDQTKILRDIVGPDKIVINCGIGTQGGSLKAVTEAGADYGIIGRSIYESDNPREAAIRFSLSTSNASKIKNTQVVRFCSETQTFTIFVEPKEEIKPKLLKFMEYCQKSNIGLRVGGEGGLLVRNGKYVFRFDPDGNCLLSNTPSANEGEAVIQRFLDEIVKDSAGL